MQLSSLISTLVLTSTVIAGPIQGQRDILSPRENSVTCTTDGKKTSIKLTYAQDQIKVAQAGGNSPGKSGDPHEYNNGDGIKWSTHACDNANQKMYEYPIYGDNKTSWKKDTKTGSQTNTPIRTVFMADGTFCGVMAHPKTGAQDFKQCK